MKIPFLTFLLLIVISSYSNADYLISWENQQAGLTVDGNIANPLLPIFGDQAVLQLWFAGADNLIDSTYFEDNSTNGDDVLLDSRIFTNSGLPSQNYGIFPADVYGGSGTPFLGPSVFMRVVRGSSIIAGAGYLTSGIFTVNNKSFAGPAPTADVIGFPAAVLGLTSIVAIPEPGTLATIAGGLAVVVFGLRRRRYRI
jgi:hypothetical protein